MRWCLLGLFVSATALANGRPPLTNGAIVPANDPHSLYIASTFGLLISHDDGCTFNWVCETDIGYGGSFDPHYAVADDGTIFATTFFGLRVSRDGGCSFQTVTDQIWVDGLDIGPTGEVWIATADNMHANDVFSSTDNGMQFTSRGMPSATIAYKSVKVARSNGQIVYLTGYEAGQTQVPHLWRTDDGGTMWMESPLAGVMYGSSPILRVAAVNPTDPDIIYVISEGANATGDRVYRSIDGGMTLTEVLATTDVVHSVVITQSGVYITTALAGSFRSDDGIAFTAMPNVPQLSCLAERSDGALIGCGTNWDPDFMAVGKSIDGGGTWSKVWRFVELAGPLDCQPGTAESDVCAPQWTNLMAQFGASGPTCGAHAVPPDAPPVQPPSGGGCCDGGGAASGPLAFALAWWLNRRRGGSRRAPRAR